MVVPVWLIFQSCHTRDPKFQQYMVEGERLYMAHCSNCHQKDGSGLGLVYPPLASSDYIISNFDQTICLIKNGTKGEMIVNGKSFNQPMPGIPSLTELEIAEIATFITNSWGAEKGMVEIKTVSKSLNTCSLK